MPLHPQTQKVIKQLYKNRPIPAWEMQIVKLRQMINTGTEFLSGKPEPVAKVENKKIRGQNGAIPIRVYTPRKLISNGLAIYFPGSGFINGSLITQDNTCRQIANRTGCKVIQSSYHSAPEFQYPIGLNDAFATIEWAYSNASKLKINKEKIAILGCSSGANFAALCAIRAKENNLPIKCVVLNAPFTDLMHNYESAKKFGSGYVLETKAIEYYVKLYLPQKIRRNNSKVSPYYKKDLSNLPPTLIQTAEYDPLADDGKRYAKKLRAANNKVKYTCYKGQIHPFIVWSGGVLNKCKNPCNEISIFLKEQFKK